MADIRTVLQNHQKHTGNHLRFQEESGTDYGVQYFDGTYTIRLAGERENNLTAENYQTEINNCLASAAQQISEGKENVWRMEAKPGYRGNAGNIRSLYSVTGRQSRDTLSPKKSLFWETQNPLPTL